MSREHVREAAVLDPEVLDRTFTLKELARMVAASARGSAEEAFAAWLARVVSRA